MSSAVQNNVTESSFFVRKQTGLNFTKISGSYLSTPSAWKNAHFIRKQLVYRHLPQVTQEDNHPFDTTMIFNNQQSQIWK